MSIRSRLARLEGGRPAKRVTIWDVLFGAAPIESLSPEDAAFVRKASVAPTRPCPIEQYLAAVERGETASFTEYLATVARRR